MDKDYYKILGVKKSSSPEEIRKAYKRLALKWHPDRNGGSSKSEEKFREVAEAYSFLSANCFSGKPEDIRSHSFKERGWGGNAKFKTFWDIIKEAPRVFNKELQISFEESIVGAEKKVSYSLDMRQSKCSSCNGTGRSNNSQRYASIFFRCNSCNGTGASKLGPEEGPADGIIDVNVVIKIPAGIKNGNVLRVKDPGKGVTIMAKVKVSKSEEFARKGNNIISSLDISLKQALLGCEKEVALVRGSRRVVVPPCFQPGTSLRLKGEGVLGGDHIIKVRVKFPKALSDYDKKLIRKLNS